MKLLVEIDMNGPAFETEPHRELACAVLHIAEALLTKIVTVPSPEDQPICDTSGNYAGFWRITPNAH